jgi:hypothetical protein
VDLTVGASQKHQDPDQSFSRVNAEVLVENSQTNLEQNDEVVLNQKIVRQNAAGIEASRNRAFLPGEPAMRPVLETEVADGDRGIRRLLRRRRTRLDKQPTRMVLAR